VRDTIFYREETKIFPALKVPKQCPFVLMVGVGWRECKALSDGFSSYVIRGRDASVGIATRLQHPLIL
jgi:hypothetical protein